jgi:hypothetical protein
MLDLIKKIEARAEMDAWYSRQARDEYGHLANASIHQECAARGYAKARHLRAEYADDIRFRSEVVRGANLQAAE